MKKIIFITLAIASSSLANAWNISILDPTNPFGYGYDMPGGDKVSNFMDRVKNGGSHITTGDLAGFSPENTDAVIINISDPYTSFTPAELSALETLINRKILVLILGDNNVWEAINKQLATVLGGSWTSAPGGDSQKAGKPTSSNGKFILNDVSNIYLTASGKMNIGGGDGEWLSSGGTISLWGAEDNILLAMDANMFGNDLAQKNDQLLQNISDFLNGANSIPEPSTWALLTGCTAIGLAAIARRRAISPTSNT